MALLWSLLVVDPLIILSTIICGSISVLGSLFDKSGGLMMKMAVLWARSILFFARVRVRTERLERIVPNEPYVFASNHLSYMDTPVVLSHIPANFRFMAKEGLFRIPFLGTHLKQAGHVAVPRDDARAALRAVQQAAQSIQSKHVSVLIFPEGGRSEDGKLQPFRDGAAYLAIKAGVPLVPIALIGTREVMPMGGSVIRGGPVQLRVGQPIPTSGLTLRDRQSLTEQAREQIEQMLR